MNTPAKIVSFEEFDALRKMYSLGKIVCTSGGYDPIHPGHTSCIMNSKSYGDTLVVIVNGDNFLTAKKGKPFMNLDTRCRLVASVRNVDYVIPFEIENDITVCVALRKLRPDVFTKGGDRTDYTNIPEWEVCKELGIEIVPKVGSSKVWSSSDLLNKWKED